MRGDHPSVFHHGLGDGTQVLEDLLGAARPQEVDVMHDAIVSLVEERGRGMREQ